MSKGYVYLQLYDLYTGDRYRWFAEHAENSCPHLAPVTAVVAQPVQ